MSAAEVEGLLTARAATELGVDVEAVELTLDAPEALHFDAGATGAVEVVRFTTDPRGGGRFEAALLPAGAGRGAKPAVVAGSAVETVEVGTLVRPLARGEVVAAADLRTQRRPKSQAADAAEPSEIVGLAARRSLREGQPLRSADLMRPQHVERGANVTLIYAASGMNLSLKAKALQAGAAGDLIQIQNIQSKRVVSGVVTGPSEVTVTSGPTTVARR